MPIPLPEPPGGSGSGIGITGIRFAAPPPPSAAGGVTCCRLWRVRASEADRGDATGLATARLGTATDRGSSSDTLLPSSSADRGRDAGRDVLPTDELADGGVAVRDTGVDGSGGDLPPLASGLAPEAVRRRDGMSSAVRVTANAGRPAGAAGAAGGAAGATSGNRARAAASGTAAAIVPTAVMSTAHVISAC